MCMDLFLDSILFLVLFSLLNVGNDFEIEVDLDLGSTEIYELV